MKTERTMGVTERERKLHTDKKGSSVMDGIAAHDRVTGLTAHERMAGPDLLRCLAMMMVVVLHFLGKGRLLGEVTDDSMGTVDTAAWVLEAFCIVAVNVYMLISGYFLSASSFKLSRLLSLYLQVWFYSVGVGLAAVVFGWLPASEADTHYFLSLLCPVFMKHYWFMTAYVFLYLLLPFLGMVVRKMTKQQLKLVLIIFLMIFCVLKSVLPFRLEEDGQGYTCMWYICLFLTAAYIRRFGMPLLEKKWRCVCLYVGGCLAMFAELMILRQVYLRSGDLELILKVSYEYNHVLPTVASVGLFGLFLKLDAQSVPARSIGALAGKLSPYVLGVYLLHENLGVRYSWPEIFGAEGIETIPGLLLGMVCAVICVFVTGVIIDWIRANIMRGIHGLLLHWKGYRWLAGSVERVDGIFKN